MNSHKSRPTKTVTKPSKSGFAQELQNKPRKKPSKQSTNNDDFFEIDPIERVDTLHNFDEEINDFTFKKDRK